MSIIVVIDRIKLIDGYHYSFTLQGSHWSSYSKRKKCLKDIDFLLELQEKNKKVKK